MSQPIVDTSDALRRVHIAKEHSDAKVRDAGETILSALVPVLRHPQALLPEECRPAWDTIKNLRD